MLSYAFQRLQENGYKHIGTEEFENAADLCAAILVNGLSIQIKQGLHRTYIHESEILPTVRGSICVDPKSLFAFRTSHMVRCSFDEFSENNTLNQIVKTTLQILLKADICTSRKDIIRKILPFFQEVSTIDLHSVNWNMHFNRNNRNYQLLIAICQLVFKGLLQTTADGSTYLLDFLDEQRMCHLYEKFLLEYYRKHWGDKLKVGSPEIPWQLDDDNTFQLPKMQSDIVLSLGDDYLIIDAKYYGMNLYQNMGKTGIHSANLYQIFTYVKNKETEVSKKENPHSVSGLLLYAMTQGKVQPDADYSMSGNRISAKTLNLDTEWSIIRQCLDGIVYRYFKL